MNDIIKLIPRTTGNNWDISKIHEQLHVADNIEKYGAHENVHTGPQEHNHIELTKKPSKQVQRKKSILDWQLANRTCEKYILNVAQQQLWKEKHHTSETTTTSPANKGFKVNATSCRFSLVLSKPSNGNRIAVLFEWLTRKQKTVQVSNEVLLALWNYFGDSIYEKEITGFTEVVKDGLIFRADINYRGMKSWYDNVMVDWDGLEHLIPAQLKMFFHFDNESQKYAVIHSCHEKFKKHSVLSNIWVKEYQNDTVASLRTMDAYGDDNNCSNRTPLLRVITCEAIHSHCLLMPVNISSQHVIHINCTSTWADEFFIID
ncbi:MAG TPA: hypothetical protein VIQ31_37300 [Phormidium sp.]